jgi:FtsH-binding integral membrane protein
MKLFWLSLLVGLILLAVVDAAFKIDSMSQEMLLHNLFHFFTGCVLFSLWVWYKHKKKITFFLYILLVFLLLDGIVDYVRGVDNMSLQMILHNLYLVFWGVVTGLLFVRYFKNKKHPVSQE